MKCFSVPGTKSDRGEFWERGVPIRGCAQFLVGEKGNTSGLVGRSKTWAHRNKRLCRWKSIIGNKEDEGGLLKDGIKKGSFAKKTPIPGRSGCPLRLKGVQGKRSHGSEGSGLENEKKVRRGPVSGR